MPAQRRKPKKSATKKNSTRRKTKKNSEAKYRIANRTKLSDTLLADCVELIEEGLPLDSTCAYLGITAHTLYDWMEKGQKYLLEVHTEEGPEFPEDELCAQFTLAVSRAKATLELSLIRELRDAKAHARWVRNMTILERRFRKDWGRSEQLHVQTETVAPDEAYL